MYYRWHPLYGQSLRVWRRMKNRHGEHIFCELPNSTICSLPAWVFSPDCASFSVGPPLICEAALIELRDVLSAWHSSTDCDKPSMEETHREVLCDSTCEAAGPTVEPTARRCPKIVIPDAKQRELALALLELLIGAAQASNPRLEDGGGDELEADR